MENRRAGPSARPSAGPGRGGREFPGWMLHTCPCVGWSSGGWRTESGALGPPPGSPAHRPTIENPPASPFACPPRSPALISPIPPVSRLELYWPCVPRGHRASHLPPTKPGWRVSDAHLSNKTLNVQSTRTGCVALIVFTTTVCDFHARATHKVPKALG